MTLLRQLVLSAMAVIGKPRTDRFRMIAKTLFGLEAILSGELSDIGAHKVRPMARSVEFYGDMELLYRSNLCCRTAVRILKPICTFKASDEKQLYKNALRVPWENYLTLDNTFAIDALVRNSAMDNSLYMSQIVKDAIVDSFRNRTGKRPSVDLKNPDIRINLYMHQNECTLAIDASGEPLFKRGYRIKSSKAPLSEVLAAGIVLQSGWDKNSNFVDAMCGSGTIVIEAALIAMNIAPGLLRKQFGFMNWPDYNKQLFEQIRSNAKTEITKDLSCEIVGSDINSRQIQEASDNAERAGVLNSVNFKHGDMSDITPPPPPGLLIINPPYGERIAVKDINDNYQSIGDALKKKYTGYDAFVFTGNLSAAKHIGLRTSRRIEMYNGPIECRLLKFEMYKGSRKAVRSK